MTLDNSKISARTTLLNLVRLKVRQLRITASQIKQQLYLNRMRARLWNKPPGSQMPCLHYSVRITDGPNFYMQFKDEFIRRIYHFESNSPVPVILDGGSNMGLSILYFKHIYPNARVIGFEPDPDIFRLLQENIERNSLDNVELINAGLGAQTGTVPFVPDGSAGGRGNYEKAADKRLMVELHQLSRYLEEPVDFLKLNIEGEELPVLQEAANSGRLRNVRQMVLEYHGWPEGPQRLGAILTLLEAQGFRYLVHDFDNETCPVTKPPFTTHARSPWFCLVYATQTNNN